METLWYELKPFGISASLIEAGFVRTGISHASRISAKTLSEYNAVRSRAAVAIRQSVEEGVAPEVVAQVVLRAAQSSAPNLRYRVGGSARWLPRLRNAAPWKIFASGVRRTFPLDASG